MEKVENQEIKDYIIKYAQTKLEDCQLFTKTFGKNFAKKRLKTIDKVYTNKHNNTTNGSYNIENDSITIYTKQTNSNPLTPDEMKTNAVLTSTALHEAMHAILKRTKIECVKNGIRYGTGILEYYKNGTTLGRGVNEGLTNWLWGKAGVIVSSYPELTNYMKMIEVAIGEENVANMGKGDIKGNIRKQLGMTVDECKHFFALEDELYFLNQGISDLKEITSIIRKYQFRQFFQSQEERENAEKEYFNLERNKLYIKIIKEKYENGLFLETDNDINEIKLECQERIKDTEERATECRDEIETLLLDKYFKKEIQYLSEMKDFDLQLMSRCDKLYEIIKDVKLLGANMSKFKQVYERLDFIYYTSAIKQARSEIEEKNLSGDRLKELVEFASRGREKYKNHFFTEISRYIYPDVPEVVGNLMRNLYKNGEINNINKYSVVEFQLENSIITTYQKDGKIIEFSNNNLEPEKNNEDRLILDSRIFRMAKVINPNAKMRIIEPLVIYENEGIESYYEFDGKQFKPVTPEIITLGFAPSADQYPIVKETKEDSRKKTKKEFHKNVKEEFDIVGALKRSLLEDEEIEYNSENTTSKYQNFKRNISDMSQYSDYIPENASSDIKEEREQEGK